MKVPATFLECSASQTMAESLHRAAAIGARMPFILLAPMEGVLDPVLRSVLCSIGGIDQAVTEFIRVTGTLLPPHVFYKYSPELLDG